MKSVEIIEVDGIVFKLYKGRKYPYNSKMRRSLHQYIWEKKNGKIPLGYHIHHKDHDIENNNLENLELIERKTHAKYHANLQNKERVRKMANDYRHLTKEWHKSEEGKEWHKQHYEATKDKLYIEKTYSCECCGKTFSSTKAGSKFCSNGCKSKKRRESGIDDVVRKCCFCGKTFTVNKYSKAEVCSMSCNNRNRKKIKDSLN